MEVLCEKDETQLVCTVVQRSEVVGYVVIDSTIGGRSCGGLRMLPDIDEAEMRGLARAMTLKYGFLGLPQGGAKAGVRCDPEAPKEERWQRLDRQLLHCCLVASMSPARIWAQIMPTYDICSKWLERRPSSANCVARNRVITLRCQY